MLQFESLKTVTDGFELDGVFVGEDHAQYPEIVARIKANDTPDPQVAANKQARRYLASTDWYVIRQGETGEPIPADVTDARAAARAAIV
jgi:hypothetical protein